MLATIAWRGSRIELMLTIVSSPIELGSNISALSSFNKLNLALALGDFSLINNGFVREHKVTVPPSENSV
jgi:hypothetical protein